MLTKDVADFCVTMMLAHAREILAGDVLVRSANWAKKGTLPRVICHLQWYVDESAELFVHGLYQTIQNAEQRVTIWHVTFHPPLH